MNYIQEVIDRVKYNDKVTEDISSVASWAQSINNREILLLGEIEYGTGAGISAIIRFWNQADNEAGLKPEDRKPIKLYIDTPGGSLTDAFTIIDTIKASKTPVWTICTGTAYSGGFFIFICGKRRICSPHASFLYHEGSAGTQCTANQFENFTDFYKKQLYQLKAIVVNNTKITEEDYETIRKDDYWLLASEALEKGCCDEVSEDIL